MKASSALGILSESNICLANPVDDAYKIIFFKQFMNVISLNLMMGLLINYILSSIQF